MPKGEKNFFNPYRLLKQPGPSPVRKYAPDLSRFDGYCGVLECKIVAYTPLEVNSVRNQNFNKSPVIPGASLKGVIRSMAEFVGGGCQSVVGGGAAKNYLPCTMEVCCMTCDMFGRLTRNNLNRGKVFISDARVVEYERHKNIKVYQGSPKVTHKAFYPNSSEVCFRKFYHHHPHYFTGMTLNETVKHANTLFPVSPGSSFQFKVEFESLDAAQVALLMYATELEPDLLHKIGRAKGRGLGSVKIQIKSKLIQTAKDRIWDRAQNNVLPSEVQKALQSIKNNQELNSLKKMLSWSIAKALKQDYEKIAYPPHHWFKTPGKSQIPLREIDELYPKEYLSSEDPPCPQLSKPILTVKTLPQHPPKGLRNNDKVPDDFPGELWQKLETEYRDLIQKICDMPEHKYKSDSQMYIERFNRSQDENLKNSIVQAFMKVVPKKDWRWIGEKFDPQYLPKEEDKAALTQDNKSDYEKAIEILEKCDSVKHINKRIMAKSFKRIKDEDKRSTLANKILKWGEERDCLEAIKKIKDLQKYLP